MSGCPEGGTDSFGAPRYVGGYHPRKGDDIIAPAGTPIRAPFDGVARDATDSIGGISVIVQGSTGWVYNAHMSQMGTLGSVQAGGIVGYVGMTGASGRWREPQPLRVPPQRDSDELAGERLRILDHRRRRESVPAPRLCLLNRDVTVLQAVVVVRRDLGRSRP